MSLRLLPGFTFAAAASNIIRPSADSVLAQALAAAASADAEPGAASARTKANSDTLAGAVIEFRLIGFSS
jgi:hypothetical protein